MPLPKRKKGESHKAFITRCMADDVMVREYSDAKQRQAVCQNQIKATSAFALEKGMMVTLPNGYDTVPRSPIEAAAVPLEWIEAAEGTDAGDKPKLKRFKIRAYNGEPMVVNAYGLPVVIDLSGLKAKAPIPILRDHDQGRVIGHADKVDLGTTTLDLSGVISGAGVDANEIIASAANGFPWRASVGARPDKLEFVGEGIHTKVNGKTFTGPLHVARKSTLGETSVVAIGADGKAATRIAAVLPLSKGTEPMTFEQWIEAIGLEMAELREDVIQNLRAKYDAELKAIAAKKGKDIKAAAADVRKPEFDLSGITLAHEKHIANIEVKAEEYRDTVPAEVFAKLCGTARKAAIEAKAIALNEEWATARLEAEQIKAAALFEADLMKEQRPKGPAIHSSNGEQSWPGIEAAFCRSTGVKDLDKHFKPEVLEASDKYKTLSIGRLLLLAAQANGYVGNPWVDSGTLRPILEAAFTTHNITDMLTRTGNKVLLDGFALAPATWREVCSTKAVKDFKATRLFRMTESLEYKEIGPAGEFHHGALGQEYYDVQAKTYGRMLALTRQDLINDDLGAFDDIRRRLGMYAGITINKLVWTAWLAQSNAGTFWTAARKNYQSGATTTLSEAGINSAVALFRQMRMPAPAGADATDETGLLNLYPTKVICPPDLEATARKFYVAQEMRDTTASTKYPTANIWFNQFRPVIVPELSDTAYTGYSATAWWLACEPSMLATFNVCFLNGVEQPVIESTDADFETLGIRFRAYTDFGVDDAEYRASFHSAGA